jgi:hypothetical protein
MESRAITAVDSRAPQSQPRVLWRFAPSCSSRDRIHGCGVFPEEGRSCDGWGWRGFGCAGEELEA